MYLVIDYQSHKFRVSQERQSDTFASRKPNNSLRDWSLIVEIIIGVDAHWW